MAPKILPPAEAGGQAVRILSGLVTDAAAELRTETLPPRLLRRAAYAAVYLAVLGGRGGSAPVKAFVLADKDAEEPYSYGLTFAAKAVIFAEARYCAEVK